MAVLLCRCCGARLEFTQGMTVVKCNYCDVRQTIPILDFDEKALLWERAEELRRSGEYDRAMSLYGQIEKLCPDDPEVYWAKVLCRYGIEYVENPVSHKRVPTINRIQYTSVIDDADYRKAVKLAENGDCRRIYILDAQTFDALRGKILSVSLNEPPYDIFICYKENDSSDRRTEDSVIAAELYRTLSAEGWRVFFSRITLENKAGTEYEPYIFAALNSAKIMLVIGTSPENINAVWVKNEWSRYLARMNENGEGILVPMYKGMLKEHLPAEFNHLHAVDMSEPDFESELVRGIRKILSKNAEPKAEKNLEIPSDNAGMLRRAELFLEDENFTKADELCEKVLDCEPENAQAYLIKLLAEYQICSAEKLGECAKDVTVSGNYAKAMRFGDDSLKSWLESEAAAAKKAWDNGLAERTAEKERAYEHAVQLIETAATKEEISKAAEILQGILDYKDSTTLFLRCAAMIKVIEDENIRKDVLKQAEIQEYGKSKAKRRKIAGFSSVAALILTVGVAGARIMRNNARIDRFMQAQSSSYSQNYARIYSQSYSTSKHDTYSSAVDLYNNGEYDKAANMFDEISNYMDSGEYVLLSKYNSAKQSEKDGQFAEAAKKYSSLGDFSDSAERARKCNYLEAARLCENAQFGDAVPILESLGNYKDSGEMLTKAYYENGKKLLDEKNYESALNSLKNAENYENSAELITEARYGYAQELASDGKYSEAIVYLEKLGSYKNSEEIYRRTKYDYAKKLRETGYYDDAIAAFTELGDYSDASEQIAVTQKMKQRDPQVGDIVTIGGWVQGKNGEYKPLEWIVLKRDGGKALVTAKYLVDMMPYGALYWKDSAVRKWLNGTFYSGAFTESEKNAVCDTALSDELGNDTLDKVFILSWDEAKDCLTRETIKTDFSEWGEKKLREIVTPTLPAGYSYASIHGDPYWLRDIGDEMRVSSLDILGYINKNTLYTDNTTGIRPAMWVDLGEL